MTFHTITLPAFAVPTLGETLTLRVPDVREGDARSLVAFLAYGPSFSRAIVNLLRGMDDALRCGYPEMAVRYLDRALELAFELADPNA